MVLPHALSRRHAECHAHSHRCPAREHSRQTRRQHYSRWQSGSAKAQWRARTRHVGDSAPGRRTPSVLAADEAGAKPKAKPAPPPHRFGREAALEAARNMVVATGLQATLFACEPDLVNPCDMDVDERGRVWITEGANYRSTFQ